MIENHNDKYITDLLWSYTPENKHVVPKIIAIFEAGDAFNKNGHFWVLSTLGWDYWPILSSFTKFWNPTHNLYVITRCVSYICYRMYTIPTYILYASSILRNKSQKTWRNGPSTHLWVPKRWTTLRNGHRNHPTVPLGYWSRGHASYEKKW